MAASTTKALMWILTIILFMGIVMTYYNLNGQYLENGKYFGLYVICLGFFGFVAVALKSKSREGFVGGVRSLKNMYI